MASKMAAQLAFQLYWSSLFPAYTRVRVSVIIILYSSDLLHDSIQDIVVSDWIFSLARAQTRCLQSRGPARFKRQDLESCIIVFSLLARFPREYTHSKRDENRRHIIKAIFHYSRFARAGGANFFNFLCSCLICAFFVRLSARGHA